MDYRKYRCNLWERLGCLAAGTAVAAAIAWLFYRSWYGMVLVIPVNYLIVSYYKNKKIGRIYTIWTIYCNSNIYKHVCAI